MIKVEGGPLRWRLAYDGAAREEPFVREVGQETNVGLSGESLGDLGLLLRPAQLHHTSPVELPENLTKVQRQCLVDTDGHKPRFHLLSAFLYHRVA